MRRAGAVAAGLMLALGAAGCTTAMRSVPVDAAPAQWEQLSGEWRGDYTMNGHDRHGLIAFRLRAAEQHASGDVLMIPATFAWPYGGMPPKEIPPGRQAQQESQLLTIRFVSAEGGRIRGSMDPYWDPDRTCQARASFLGTLRGDTMTGSFTTVCEGGVRALEGRWRVDRNRHPVR